MKHRPRDRSGRRTWPSLIGWLLLAFAAAAVGAAATTSAPEFYASLDRPDWAPPAWLFGPVWSVLYALIGVAAWLVWKTAGEEGPRRAALVLFVLQLGANALWTWIFFAWRSGLPAFAEILVLLVLILATMGAFLQVRPLAGVLFIPYLAWVSYAAALTYSVWRRNPDVLG